MFFAVPAANPLFKVHKLFLVSTVDRVPPPHFAVAVSTKLKALVLDSKDLSGWNTVAAEERWSLQTDEDWKQFARSFLDLAAGRSFLLDDLARGEKNRVEKKLGKSPTTEFRVIREGKRIRLQFWGKDVGGAIQQWDLLLEATGHILKANVREF